MNESVPRALTRTYLRFTIRQDNHKETEVRILFGEKNQLTRDAVRELLEEHGHTVTAVENGNELLKRVVACRGFDAVIAGNGIDHISGIQALQLIRSRKTYHDLPVIICSITSGLQDHVERMGGIFVDKMKFDTLPSILDGIAAEKAKTPAKLS